MKEFKELNMQTGVHCPECGYPHQKSINLLNPEPIQSVDIVEDADHVFFCPNCNKSFSSLKVDHASSLWDINGADGASFEVNFPASEQWFIDNQDALNEIASNESVFSISLEDDYPEGKQLVVAFNIMSDETVHTSFLPTDKEIYGVLKQIAELL